MRLTAIIAALGLCAVLAVTASAQNTSADEAVREADRRLRPPGAGLLERPRVGHDDQEPVGLRVLARARDREAARDRPERTSSSCGRRSGRFCSPGKKRYDFALEETTITAQRAKVDRLLDAVLRREPGRARSRRGRREADDHRDLQGRSRRARRPTTTGLGYIQHKLRPTKKPLVYSASSSAAFDAVEARQVPGADPRRADRRLAEPEEAGRVRRRRRADRHGRGLRRGHGEGQRAEAVRRSARSRRSRRTGRSTKLQKKWLPFTRVPVLR